MSPPLLEIATAIAPVPITQIIHTLKSHPGLTVGELSVLVRMSYMGAKRHCVVLERKGYLDCVRRLKNTGGRPEKLYRLTRKSDCLFQPSECPLVLDLLETSSEVFGEPAVESLLRHHFLKKQQHYLALTTGQTLLARAQSLSRVRSMEGHLCSCDLDQVDGIRLIEFHSPWLEVARRFPLVTELEIQMLGQVLGCLVTRQEHSEGTYTRVEFRLRWPGNATAA